MSAKERLKKYLKYKKIKQSTFAESIGASIGYVNALSKGFGPDYEKKVRQIYPDLNIGWLITGDGPMILEKAPTHQPQQREDTELRSAPSEWVTMPRDVFQLVCDQAAAIRQMTEERIALREELSAARGGAKAAEITTNSVRDAKNPPP